jgi:hypothetical protein
MMIERSHRLTLDQPAGYEIKVPGVIDFHRSDWVGNMNLSVQGDEAGYPITILTGELDQAALHGLLRRLYAQGLPIILVRWIETESEMTDDSKLGEMDNPKHLTSGTQENRAQGG